MDRSGVVRAVEDAFSGTEAARGCQMLLAVEAGSRAWGYADPGSDHDVRFVYVRPCRDYLRLVRPRDVIEMRVSDEVEATGWDLVKYLLLLRGSNPSALEWLTSPVVYQEDVDAMREVRALARACCDPKKLAFHYLSQARGNQKAYCSGETVPVKKYMGVLRTSLCAQWAAQRRTMPPASVDALIDALMDGDVRDAAYELLGLKREGATERIARVELIDRWLERTHEQVESIAASMLPRRDIPSQQQMDDVFHAIVMRNVASTFCGAAAR